MASMGATSPATYRQGLQRQQHGGEQARGALPAPAETSAAATRRPAQPKRMEVARSWVMPKPASSITAVEH